MELRNRLRCGRSGHHRKLAKYFGYILVRKHYMIVWFPYASHHYPWQNQSRTTAHYAHKQPLCTLCPLITYIGYMRLEREYLRMFAHGYDIIVLSMSPWLSLLTPKLSHHHSRGSRLWYMPLFKCLEKFSAPSFAWYSTHLQLRSSTLLPHLDPSNHVNLASGASTHSPSVSAMCQLHFFFGFWRFHLELRHFISKLVKIFLTFRHFRSLFSLSESCKIVER